MWLWIALGVSPFVLLAVWLFSLGDDIWKDEDFGDLDVRAVLRGKRDDINTLFEQTDQGAWDVRYLRSLGLSRSLRLQRIEAWLAAEPSSSSAHLVHGARLLQLAWEARGYGRGHEVTEEGARRFAQLVHEARAALETSARLNALDPTPWAYLIMVATYAGDDDAQRQHYFAEAIARDPDHWPAHHARHWRWAGTECDLDEAKKFARG